MQELEMRGNTIILGTPHDKWCSAREHQARKWLIRSSDNHCQENGSWNVMARSQDPKIFLAPSYKVQP